MLFYTQGPGQSRDLKARRELCQHVGEETSGWRIPVVQRPWGRLSQAARGLEPAGTGMNDQGGRRQPTTADCLTRRPAVLWPPRARPPAFSGSARGGGGAGRARAGGSARRPLREATLQLPLQVRIRRSRERARARGGVRGPGPRPPQPPRAPVHTCHARRVPGSHARGPRSSGRGRPRLRSSYRLAAPRGGAPRQPRGWPWSWQAAVRGGRRCISGGLVVSVECAWALGHGWQV